MLFFFIANTALLDGYSYSNVLRLCAKVASSLSFVVFFLWLSANRFISKMLNWFVWRFLGSFSLEIYVLQGIPLNLFDSQIINVESAGLYILCVTLSTALLIAALHPIIHRIIAFPKKLKR